MTRTTVYKFTESVKIHLKPFYFPTQFLIS
jgi:hypothetical protein